MRQGDRLLGDGLLVVVPTYDERENLERLWAALREALPRAQLLVVDDASPDGTGALADELASRAAPAPALHRPGKLGLGTAYVEGFRWGLERGFERIGQMDADLSHDPRDLARLDRALDAGFDLAVGSRNVLGGGVVGWGLGRHALSKGGSLYARLALGSPIHDMTTGLKVWRRDALGAIDPGSLRSNGYAFQIETTHRALARGLRVVELPIVFTDRRVGQSKMSRAIFAEAVIAVWRLRLAGRR